VVVELALSAKAVYECRNECGTGGARSKEDFDTGGRVLGKQCRSEVTIGSHRLSRTNHSNSFKWTHSSLDQHLEHKNVSCSLGSDLSCGGGKRKWSVYSI